MLFRIGKLFIAGKRMLSGINLNNFDDNISVAFFASLSVLLFSG